MGRSRNLAMIFGGAGLLLALVVALIFRPAGATAQAQTSQAQRGGTYVGVATCSGSTCHGRSEPTGKIVALARQLGEDPDVLLAMAGKVSSDLQEAIRTRPELFAALIRELKEMPDRVVQGIVREVRDGKW